jgi:hypothetical protein
MIVTLEISEASKATIARHGKASTQTAEAMAAGVQSAAVAGADAIRAALVMGRYGLVMRHPGTGGLADSVFGWMIDERIPLAAVGVPANTPAHRYAGKLEFGGTISGHGKKLSIPISPEAKTLDSPLRMGGRLTFIPRRTGAPLLIEEFKRKGHVVWAVIHWVLVSSVYIPPFRWLSRGVDDAAPAMGDQFGVILQEHLEDWTS